MKNSSKTTSSFRIRLALVFVVTIAACAGCSSTVPPSNNHPVRSAISVSDPGHIGEHPTKEIVTAAAQYSAQSLTPDGIIEPLTEAERAALPTEAALSTYGAVAALFDGKIGDDTVAPDSKIWVAVVHGTVFDPDSIAGAPIEDIEYDVYTVIFDEASGTEISQLNGRDVFALGLPKT